MLMVDLEEWLLIISDIKKKSGVNKTHSVERSLPVRGSQNLTSISLEPETIRPFVGCQSTHLTSQPWPVDDQLMSIPAEKQTHHSDFFLPWLLYSSKS